MLGQSLYFLHQKKKSESRVFGASGADTGAQDEDSEFPGRIECSVMASVQHLLFGALR